MMERIYSLYSEESKKFAQIPLEEKSTRFISTESIWQITKGNFDKISLPLIFEVKRQGVYADMIETQWPAMYLVSEKFRSFWNENQFVGAFFYDVIIKNAKGAVPEGYMGLSIVGRCGPIDYKKCDVFEVENENGITYKVYQDLPIDEADWDRSDIFMPIDTFQIFVSEKVALAVKKAQLTGIKTIPKDQIQTYEYGVPEKFRK